MQWRLRWIGRFIVVAFILAQLVVPAVGWAQEATPGTNISHVSGNCDEDTSSGDVDPIKFNGELIFSREQYRLKVHNTQPDGDAIVAGWSLLCAKNVTTNIFLEVVDGQILLDVREGSVTLTIACPDANGSPTACPTAGEMRHGTYNNASGGFTWSNVTTLTLTSPTPDVVSLSNVTVKITFGTAGPTRLFVSGWSSGLGGSSCSAACIHVP